MIRRRRRLMNMRRRVIRRRRRLIKGSRRGDLLKVEQEEDCLGGEGD